MISKKTECPAYDPEMFSLLHQGNPGDVQFYVSRCPEDHSVLELGCGPGRITLALLEAGRRVWALDNHPGMIGMVQERAAELGEQKASRLNLTQADMTTFSLGSKFRRVIIPFNGLFCLLSEEDVRCCFERVLAHLEPQGQLILDAYRVFAPDPDYEGEDDPEPLTTLTDGQTVVEVFERSDWDRAGQRLDAYYMHRILGPDGRLREEEYCIPQRYLFPQQLFHLLGECGFEILERLGDFEGSPFDDNSEHMVVVARPS